MLPTSTDRFQFQVEVNNCQPVIGQNERRQRPPVTTDVPSVVRRAVRREKIRDAFVSVSPGAPGAVLAVLVAQGLMATILLPRKK